MAKSNFTEEVLTRIRIAEARMAGGIALLELMLQNGTAPEEVYYAETLLSQARHDLRVIRTNVDEFSMQKTQREMKAAA